jgi:hypothetical protein
MSCKSDKGAIPLIGVLQEPRLKARATEASEVEVISQDIGPEV